MRARARVRLVWVVVAALVALAIAMYTLNPLKVPSGDPRLRILGISLYRIPTHGMEPTIGYGKIVLASAWPYCNADPKPGDIIMFRDPLDDALLYAKRVIASGGSTVEIVNGVTIVDGHPLAEPYLGGVAPHHELSRSMPKLQVPAGTYFVMGDNRDDSYDSRMFGFIARGAVVARVE